MIMDTSVQFNEDSLESKPKPEPLRRAPTHVGKVVFQRTKTDLLRQTFISETSKFAKQKEKSLVAKNNSNIRDAQLDDDNDDVDTRQDETGIDARLPTGSDIGEESSGAEYDTDLEIERRAETPRDRCGKRTYCRSCKRMGLIPVGAISRSLKNPIIEVRGRGMNEKDALAMTYALLENTTVKHLCLDENCIGDKGAEYVALMLYENDSLEELSLCSNHISSLGVRAILEMMLDNNTLVVLNLSGNNLCDTDAYMFAEYIEDTNVLKDLNLSNNDFGDEAAMVLGPAIGVNESIRKLDLSWNKIRTKGGVSICRGLAVNVTVTILNLAYNGLSNMGAVQMAEALKANEILLDLDLTCNRIFDEGTAHIGQALNINESLKYLRIANNPMTTISAVTLLNVLKQNEYSALELLDMSSIHIYKNALDVVDEIRVIRPSFKFLYGGVVNSDDGIGAGMDAMHNKNPLQVLKEYIAKENLRLVDLFKMFDRDGGGSLSREEFTQGLKTIEIPMSQAQLDRLMNMLDKDGDGEIDYGELVQGDREYRRKMLMLKQQALTRIAKGAKKKDEQQPKPKLLMKRSSQEPTKRSSQEPTNDI